MNKKVFISENKFEISFDKLLKIKTITDNPVVSVSEYIYYINIILNKLIGIELDIFNSGKYSRKEKTIYPTQNWYIWKNTYML